MVGGILLARRPGRLGAAGAVIVATMAALMLGGCGADDGGRGTAAERSEKPPRRRPAEPARKGGRPAEPCPRSVRAEDPPGDTRPWRLPNPSARPPTPPSADLRRFELSSTRAGICARWTTAASAPAGTELVLVAHSPLKVHANRGAIAHGYGFEVRLLGPGGIATYGLDRLGSDEPRVLRARVGQSGRTASVFVPRAELDRPPANMRGRPSFPYRGFNFEARVISPRDSRGGQDADFWPQEQEGKAGYVDGRLCEPPCMELLR